MLKQAHGVYPEAIAAMAGLLPKVQLQIALRLGLFGAYLFRGICMGLAAWIIENPWLKIGGGCKPVYLMCHHFTLKVGPVEESGNGTSGSRGFIGTIIAIEVIDLSLSVDNVVAAVAMSPKLWVVCTGGFIGIPALRFVAGACLKLIERYPILEETASLLIGHVGFILVFELLCVPPPERTPYPCRTRPCERGGKVYWDYCGFSAFDPLLKVSCAPNGARAWFQRADFSDEGGGGFRRADFEDASLAVLAASSSFQEHSSAARVPLEDFKKESGERSRREARALESLGGSPL